MNVQGTESFLTVSRINQYIKQVITSDGTLSNLWIQGELSNFKLHTSGHAYFSLKDSGGVLRCVMFQSRASRLTFRPQDGMKVFCFGSISVYERDGSYQLYVEQMEPDGTGALYLAYEQLKKKLQGEGLFDAERKRKIPFLPSCIGVVTSETGAVIRDIMNVTFRRFPNMRLKLFPVAVQGEGAAEQIAAALDRISRTVCCDVVIVARGGGSLEDLWAFNEETTARAIAACSVPVISAVGHETDFTIADFVADLRAPTPSAAAELAVPEYALLLHTLQSYQGKIQQIPLQNIRLKRAELERVKSSPFFRRPYDFLYQEREYLSGRQERLAELAERKRERDQQRLQALRGRLEALSPLRVLERGYSMACKADGSVIVSPEQLEDGGSFVVTVRDGSFPAKKSGGEKNGI